MDCKIVILLLVFVGSGWSAEAGNKCECPSTENKDVCEDYKLVGISDDSYLNLLVEPSGDIREDVKIPDGELGFKIRAEFDNGVQLVCTVLKGCGEDHVIAFKEFTVSEIFR